MKKPNQKIHATLEVINGLYESDKNEGKKLEILSKFLQYFKDRRYPNNIKIFSRDNFQSTFKIFIDEIVNEEGTVDDLHSLKSYFEWLSINRHKDKDQFDKLINLLNNNIQE